MRITIEKRYVYAIMTVFVLLTAVFVFAQVVPKNTGVFHALSSIATTDTGDVSVDANNNGKIDAAELADRALLADRATTATTATSATNADTLGGVTASSYALKSTVGETCTLLATVTAGSSSVVVPLPACATGGTVGCTLKVVSAVGELPYIRSFRFRVKDNSWMSDALVFTRTSLPPSLNFATGGFGVSGTNQRIDGNLGADNPIQCPIFASNERTELVLGGTMGSPSSNSFTCHFYVCS